MKRLFPAPLLSLALWLLWLVLNLSISPGHLLLGAVLGLLAPLLMAPLRPLPVRIRKPGTILKFLCLVGWDVVVSNLQVGLSVWRLESRPPRSAFVRIPLDLHDAHGLAALAMVITLLRLLKGPSAQDRVLALDYLYIIAMLMMLVLGIRYASDTYFEAAMLIALFGFVGSFALAKFLLRGEVIE
ncbi:K+/H+ antiporter subunit F [Pseudomonas amygdali]|nr:K+/H+ antiporter subunit F [Pseudomonas amygdali]KPX54192.1 putative monovalent cation/H+ antiporter subunit E [Pseudomonas amygdali pv. photiniae]